MKNKKETVSQIMRFGVTGVIATAAHYGIYALLKWYIPVNAAYTIGYALSFVLNYFMSARYTFRKKTSVGNGMKFACAHAINYMLQIALLNLFLSLGVSDTMAPIPVYGIAIPVNFLMVRFVFKH